MSNAVHPMSIDIENLSMAVAYIEKDDDLNLSIAWQNKAADAIWDDYDINADVDLKLQIIQTFSQSSPASFTYQLAGAVQACRFIITEMGEGLLVQFHYGEVRQSDKTLSQKSIHEMMLETSNTCGMEWNLLTNRVYYTQNFYDICNIDYPTLGYHFDSFIERVHPAERQYVQDILHAHSSVSWTFDVEFRFRTGSNHYIWLGAVAKAVSLNDDPELTHLIVAMHDITEKKSIEQSLKTREQLIEQVLDSLPVSIYVKDESGCYRFFSHQAELEMGYSRKKILGKTDFEMFDHKHAKTQFDEDAEVAKYGRTIIQEERLCHGDDEHNCKWYLRGKGPINIKVDDYEKTWVLGFMVDITHQKDTESKLMDAKQVAEKALKAKADFLSIMSHEIRTPLNTVIGGAQLLMMNEFDEEYRSQIEMIHHSGEHLLNLINDILDLSKMEAQKLQLESIPFDLSQLVEIVVKMNQHIVHEKQLSLEMDIQQELLVYRLGDAARLRQVLLNLISNAVKFTESGGIKLKILKAEQGEDWVRFEVKDSGIGISDVQRHKLFKEYAQAESSITRKYGGTGLGLLICQKIVELMSGSIGVESEPDKGSTFWFEVPLAINNKPENESVEIDNSDQEGVIESRPLSILVAEDNPTNQMLIKAILKKLGHESLIANNGLEAVEMVQGDKPVDLILMDLNMPEMGGIEATKVIRDLSSDIANIPIVALTANAFDSAHKEVFEAGMNDFLTKPINLSALGRVLDTWGNGT